MPNNSSINNSSNIRPHESTHDTPNDRIIDDNAQSKTDQFNDLQSLIMSNDISPEELQKKLDEIYYANTVGVRQNNQNQTAQIKKTYGKDSVKKEVIYKDNNIQDSKNDKNQASIPKPSTSKK